jgi:2-dehydro-3-deoxyphosphooctonate aldolase (KDO 8-P synthase)
MAMHSDVKDLFERRRLVLIAGPCVIESEQLCLDLAQAVAEKARTYGVGYIFKASFDKANRTSQKSFRGHGIDQGLQILARVKKQIGVPVITDVHAVDHVSRVADVVDVLQVPAFLCRQTDLLYAVGECGKPCMVKKGQFLAPEDMKHVVAKVRDAGGVHVAVAERGSTFGYHNLVVDMRGLVTMREVTQAPVVFDATHSVQRPSAGEGVSSGDRTMAPVLARAAAAVGIDGLFCEVHFNPDEALSDGPNALDMALLDTTLQQVTSIDALLRKGV